MTNRETRCALIVLRCHKCGTLYGYETEQAAALREGDLCRTCKKGFLERVPGKLTLH